MKLQHAKSLKHNQQITEINNRNAVSRLEISMTMDMQPKKMIHLQVNKSLEPDKDRYADSLPDINNNAYGLNKTGNFNKTKKSFYSLGNSAERRYHPTVMSNDKYKKGLMMQNVNLKNPDQFISRGAANLKNYYINKQHLEQKNATSITILDLDGQKLHTSSSNLFIQENETKKSLDQIKIKSPGRKTHEKPRWHVVSQQNATKKIFPLRNSKNILPKTKSKTNKDDIQFKPKNSKLIADHQLPKMKTSNNFHKVKKQSAQTAEVSPRNHRSTEDMFKSLIRETEDHQKQMFDSDDEYEVVKQQMSQKEFQGEELNQNSKSQQIIDPYKDIDQPSHILEEMHRYSQARNILISMKNNDNKSYRETQVEKKLSTYFQGQRNFHETMKEYPSNNLDNFTSEKFKLINKMSKMVKFTNNSVNSVIGTLNNYKMTGNATSGEVDVDTSDLLNKTSTNIKNLNHSLIKLVAVQQESISISRNVLSQFVVWDRVATYLEIDAKMIPYPAKIIIKPNVRKYGYSETVQKIIENNMSIYLSTQTKNPNHRNNQLAILPPVKRVFNFAPLISNQKSGMKDIFENKIYIALQYDLQNVGIDTEDIQQIQMQILVSFPKDKDEIEKKRMAAMFKKIGNVAGGGIQDGEQRLKQINQDLTKFYKENKGARNQKKSPELSHRTGFKEGGQYKVQTQNGSVAMPLNQLVDMYAFGNSNVFGRNDSAGSLSQGSDGTTEVNHVARNAFVSSQYKHLNDIRMQLNQDIFYTRLFNSIQKANIMEDEKRLKSVKWLNKWDEFRKIKMQYVDQVVKLLKGRRRVISLITLINVVKQLNGIKENYLKLKKFNMNKLITFTYSVKMFFKYKTVYIKKYGQGLDYRLLKHIKRCATFKLGALVYPMMEERAKDKLELFLRRKNDCFEIKAHMYHFYKNCYKIQCSFRQVKLQRQINMQYSVLRFKQELNRLKFFYLKKAKNKVHARIFSKLDEIDMVDCQTQIDVERYMELYRESQRINYKIEMQEKAFRQTQVYIEYFEEEHPQRKKLMQDIINTGAKMEELNVKYEVIQKELFEDSSLCTAQLSKDAPHYDKDNNDLPDPVNKHSEKKIPEKFEKSLASQKDSRKQEVVHLNSQVNQMQTLLQKQTENKKKISSNMFIPNIYSSKTPGFCILREKDKQYDCYEDVLDKIYDMGLNELDPFMMMYKKETIYRIVFKVGKIEELLKEIAQESPNVKK